MIPANLKSCSDGWNVARGGGNKSTSSFNVVIYITAIYNATKSDT